MIIHILLYSNDPFSIKKNKNKSRCGEVRNIMVDQICAVQIAAKFGSIKLE